MLKSQSRSQRYPKYQMGVLHAGIPDGLRKTGNENLSVSRMAVTPFNATLVTAKPLQLYCGALRNNTTSYIQIY